MHDLNLGAESLHTSSIRPKRLKHKFATEARGSNADGFEMSSDPFRDLCHNEGIN